jgi:hypothetical protein
MKFIRVSSLVFLSMNMDAPSTGLTRLLSLVYPYHTLLYYVSDVNIIFFRSFRQKYLQSGGHDPKIIAGYSDLEYRLRSYSDYPWSKNSPEPLRQARCLYFYIFCFFTFCVYV